MDRGTSRRINRAHWDALASAHGQDAYYDTEALVAGADTLHEAESAAVREAVGAVAGLDVLHLQCHIGFDAISLARRGARVVGVDFSPASLEKARALARRCEVRVEFVEADAAAVRARGTALVRRAGVIRGRELDVAATESIVYGHSIAEVV